jgi:hypothetical protein
MRPSLTVLLFAAACAHNELTVSENRNEAAIHQARALEERKEFDPNQTHNSARRGSLNPNDQVMVPEFTYNPTQSHQVAADAELRAASEHLRAAKELESFEDAACRDLPAAERASCPLLGSSVFQVRHTASGFQLVMKPNVDVGDIDRRLSCHLAYARARGFDRPSCPLFVKGTTLHRVGEDTIAFEGDTKSIAVELQVQADRLFARTAPR